MKFCTKVTRIETVLYLYLLFSTINLYERTCKGKKGKLFLYLIEHHVMKIYPCS